MGLDTRADALLVGCLVGLLVSWQMLPLAQGFRRGAKLAAALCAAGGALAWLTISSDVLETEPAPGGDVATGALHDFSCAVAGPPLRPGREAKCHPIAANPTAV